MASANPTTAHTTTWAVGYKVAAMCRPTVSTTCNAVGFSIGKSASGSTFAFGCTLTSGTITIASISNSNTTGSFTGSGICANGSTFATSPFTVTNGSFNVPLLTNVPGSL